MNLLGELTRFYVPTVIKKKNLSQLFQLSARAFHCEPPDIKGKSYRQMLQEFAFFTQNAAREVITGKGDIQKVKKRLYRNAFLLGNHLRKLFKIHNPDEVMLISKKLYDILKIDFQGDPFGNITIKRCYFSTYYSQEICQLISALDEGIAAGLSGGGKLAFQQRITEGRLCCLGKLTMPEI
jgi:predicted nucleic-acid-binding Zn-ribbon protein